MRADQWSGLVTKASPYILPAGAAVDQVNLHTFIPGQLTTRDGMRRVSCVESASDVLQCVPCEVGGQTVLVALLADGTLAALRSPAYGPETALPSEPPLSLSSGQSGATYTNRFHVGQVAESAPEPAPTPQYVSELYGGRAATASWPYAATGGSASLQPTAKDYFGGTASTPDFPPSLPLASLPTP